MAGYIKRVASMNAEYCSYAYQFIERRMFALPRFGELSSLPKWCKKYGTVSAQSLRNLAYIGKYWQFEEVRQFVEEKKWSACYPLFSKIQDIIKSTDHDGIVAAIEAWRNPEEDADVEDELEEVAETEDVNEDAPEAPLTPEAAVNEILAILDSMPTMELRAETKKLLLEALTEEGMA